jgi:hypothetical protein
MTLFQNPNATRPKLTIGARPLALEVFKSRVGLAEPVKVVVPEQHDTHDDVGVVVPDTGVQVREGDVAGGPRVQRAGNDKIELADEPRRGPRQRGYSPSGKSATPMPAPFRGRRVGNGCRLWRSPATRCLTDR